MIHTEDRDGVRTIGANRPPSNSLSEEFLVRLADAAKAAANDPAVRAVVLRSELPKYFSAGLDGEDLVDAQGRPRPALFEKLFAMYRAWIELPKPTIASVEGYALAGGCILAMTCDFRILALETGRLALNEIRLGLSPTPLFLSRLLSIGVSQTGVRQLALKGRTLRAEEALAVGLVDRVVPAAQLAEEAFAEARSLTRLPPLAYGAVKRHILRASGPDFETLWRESLAEFARLVESPEAREALGAVAARRKSSSAAGAD